jgi:exodeoxyribonuclease VII small subunit
LSTVLVVGDSNAPHSEVHTMAKKKAAGAGDREGEPLSFEQALDRLEKIVARLEGGQLGLDDSLAQYEQGIKYLKHCLRQLERAERKIELLSGVDEQGRVRGEPFGEADMSLEEKQASRSRRRRGDKASRDRDADPGMDDPATLF